jgi:hypothetical protein
VKMSSKRIYFTTHTHVLDIECSRYESMNFGPLDVHRVVSFGSPFFLVQPFQRRLSSPTAQPLLVPADG